jgi:zinc knuckle protein/retrotransposon gag protein
MSSMQPPIFDPGNSTGAVQDPYSFLDFYHRWCRCQPGNWNDTKCIETVPMFLRGGALFFYNNYEREKRSVDGAWAALTWDVFKADFIAAFPSTSSPFQLETQLKERKMVASESMEAYYYSILELINRVDPGMIEPRKITTIISGLPEHIVQSMSMSLPTTLAELKTKILSVSQHSLGQNRTAQLYANVSPAAPVTAASGGLPSAVTITNSTSTNDLQNIINAALKSQKKYEKKQEEKGQKLSSDLTVKQMMSQLGVLGMKVVPRDSKQDHQNESFKKGNPNKRWNQKRGGWDNRNVYPQQQQQQVPYFGQVSAVTDMPYGYSAPTNFPYPPQASQPTSTSQPQASQYGSPGSDYYSNQGNQNADNSSYVQGETRGRGQRGNRGYGGRGRGAPRGRGSSKGKGDFSSGRDAEGNPICFNCGKQGHISRDCKKPRAGTRGKN